MARRNLPDFVLAVVIIASLILGATGSAFGAMPAPGVSNTTMERELPPQEPEIAPAPPVPPSWAEKHDKVKEKKQQRITQEERQAAAERAAATGFELAAIGEATMAAPGTAPRYFSHPNYANSPLPTVVGQSVVPTLVGNMLGERAYASDFPVAAGELAPVLVVLPAPLPAGTLTSFQTWNQATAGSSPFPSAGNIFHAYVLRPTGVADEYAVIFDSGALIVPPLVDPNVSDVASFAVTPVTILAGDMLAFYGQGVPLDDSGGSDILSYPAPNAPSQGATIALGGTDFPILNQTRTYSFGAMIDIANTTPTITGGIKKFVDGLAGLGAGGANNLGQYISVASADTTTYAGADYYEIAVVQYREKMHTDLPPTLLRGYVQLAGKTPCDAGEVELFNEMLIGDPVSTGYCGTDEPHYLGATIAATKDRPVRILFRNLLPTGQGGDLFLPTDVTVMGAGMGPALAGMVEVPDGTNPTCGASTDKPAGCFTENRAVLHLHGGITPWISDGTPHQWITPAGEQTYPDGSGNENKGVSVQYVPDMWYVNGATVCAGQLTCDVAGATNYPGPGAQTYYYTNQQSARLMFYHDHAWGITRLNVYGGEAAGYLITDDIEKSLISQGLIPGAADTIPLVVQDKTFVPPVDQLAAQDETWDTNKWGGEGNLWLPHVYSPAQNPGDSSGVNQFGRWAYGPWFWPPTNNITYPPIANAYYDETCNPDEQWCEPPLMPGTPYNSMGMEAFHDTPVVNGTVYPTITVDPKSYRLRILNAASDRFFNLSLYKAVDANGVLCDSSNPAPATESTGVTCTEVALNPAEVAAALDDPTVFPTPLAGTEGPNWIQFGTEGGFLPAPVVIPPQFTTWVNDPTVFNAGNVDLHSLLLGPAERADVVVDFSQFAGQTLILYNDAPAAFPARDPRYDYYTGNGDYTDTGGATSTLPGYGPNTRTVMQIKVKPADVVTPAPAFDLGALQTAFKAKSLGGQGVFEDGQHPIIVGQGAYNSAYGTAFQNNGPNAGLVQIFNTTFSFKTLSGGANGPSLTFPLMPKQIQDEMGEAFDHEYGRMSGFLGVESPNPQAGVQNMILYPFVNPASELLDMTNLPKGNVEVTPISVATDGTQIWKITHNGVDTHPIHFHLYDVQLINRVGWDGIIRKPDLNELGWKDTVRISPLEDTIVALRPVLPYAPWDLPNSIRPLNPMAPLGSTLVFNNQDAWGNPTAPITNEMTNFGWEYVWHCHILSHEEMDMMRPQSAAVPPIAAMLSGVQQGSGNSRRNVLTWLDNSKNETGFLVQRATNPAGPWTDLATVAANITTYTDQIGNTSQIYFYQVVALNHVGYTGPAAQPGAYSTLTVRSISNTVQVPAPQPPAAPSNLTATILSATEIRLNWTDNAANETGFEIERATGGGAFALIATVGANTTTYTNTGLTAGIQYAYRVRAVNAAGPSAYSNTVSVTISLAPAAPTNVNVVGRAQGANAARFRLTWTDVANETGYTVQRATNATFTTGLTSVNLGANVTAWDPNTNLSRNTDYYFRVRANNASGSSAWVNATPFPVRFP